jgi:hypothetical protein
MYRCLVLVLSFVETLCLHLLFFIRGLYCYNYVNIRHNVYLEFREGLQKYKKLLYLDR